MTRQIALGAIIAFAVTVLALSVWEPKASVEAPAAPPPAPAPAPAPAPVPLGPSTVMLKPAMLRPSSFRLDAPNRKLAERAVPVIAAPEADAGSAP